MKLYVAEIQDVSSFRKAEEIEVKDMAAAKRKASQMRCFEGTVLEIGDSVDENGFLTNKICRKVDGKWMDID